MSVPVVPVKQQRNFKLGKRKKRTRNYLVFTVYPVRPVPFQRSSVENTDMKI